ncbi:MAG: hypothetical protein ABH914_01080 [Candidatus Omnitrophota bacterium]
MPEINSHSGIRIWVTTMKITLSHNVDGRIVNDNVFQAQKVVLINIFK